MKSTYLMIIAIFIGLVFLSSSEASGQSLVQSPPNESMELSKFLKDIGDKYDCHFTIEEALKSGNIDNSIEKKKIAAELKKGNLRNELAQLSRLVPNFTYEFDAYNSKIIHIIDARLVSKRDYPMRKIITDISFDGKVFDFIDAIASKSISVSPRGLVDIHDNMSTDFSTRVNVRERGKSVRNLLTNSITVKNRPRVLWIARTELARNATTYIRYLR